MTDSLTPAQRHRCMSRIRSRDTKTEMLVRRYLFSHGLRYRVNDRRLPGTPDIVLRRYRTCIFINGCFWHGHENCRYYQLPKSNTAFWQSKIEGNRRRDEETYGQLHEMGWNVIRIWGCQLKPAERKQTLEALLVKLGQFLLVDYGSQDECERLVAEEASYYGKRRM